MAHLASLERPLAVPELLYLLHADPSELRELLAELRTTDIAESLRDLPPNAAAEIMAALSFDLAVQVFGEPELDGRRCAILQAIGEERAGPIINALSSDERADLFRELPLSDRARFLRVVDEPSRRSLTLLLTYPRETAGGIMTTEFVSIPVTWTVQHALDHIRAVGRAMETVYVIYLLDSERDTLVQTVSLRDLVVADPLASVADVGNRRKPLAVPPHTDREEVARIISRYDLLALPVLDETGHVLGIVTVDDVIDAIVREQTEDVHRFGGVEALDEPYTEIAFTRMIRKRAGWLCALFLGEMLTATAMGRFEGEIAKAVVLSMFIPLIISSGGNSGSQATSLIIRALALRELRLGDWWRVFRRELPSGLTLGLILGLVGIARIVIWQQVGWYDYGPHSLLVAATVGMALVGVVTFGSLAGSMLPFLLQRLGFDPASASAPFIATLVDVTGLVIYFSVAAVVLRGTLL